MRNPFIRLTAAAALGVALCALPAKLSLAGGGSFDSMDDDDADAGPPYVGDVKDRSGNPVADAKITVAVKAFNSSLVLRADDQGHFLVKGFDKTVNPDEVEVSCSMEGYKPYAVSRQPTGTEAKSPIEIICLLEKN